MSSPDRVYRATKGNLSRVDTGKPQIGVVKDNSDSERMGRLKVWIRGSNTLETDPSGWIICNYSSPFAGASDPVTLGNALQDFNSTQTSYGIWAVPPDTGNEVIVQFINGDIRQAYWTGCLYQKAMNYMVPGLAGGASYQSGAYGGNPPPVAEYNKLGTVANQRPAYQPLADGLQLQGLIGDPLRGAGSSSARRESPSQVQGWLTPGGNQFIMDDGEGSELIRIRTVSGAQILISETEGHIYAISRDGKNWFELNNDGNIDMYCAGFNIHSLGDINLYSGNNVNIESAKDINLKGDNNINVEALSNLNLNSASNTNITAGANYNLVSKGDTSVTTHGATINAQYGDVRSWRKAGAYKNIHDTLSHPATDVVNNSPPPETTATIPTTHQQSILGANLVQMPLTTICTRFPDHEPWAPHDTPSTTSAPPQTSAASYVQAPVSRGSIVDKAQVPLPIVGTPTTGMTPGQYIGQGYDKNNNPVYSFAGTTTALAEVASLSTSDEGIEFIKTQEGFRSKPYPDASGKAYDIGYAHTILPSDPADVRNGPISQETATEILKNDVKIAENGIKKLVKVPLTQSQFDALVDFVYDGGSGMLQKSTLLQKLNAGNYADVPSELAKYVYANHVVLPALVRRRRGEALMFARTVTSS